MSKCEYEFYGIAVYVEKRGNHWDGWVKGQDHTIFETSIKKECLDELRSEAFFQTHQHLKKL